MKYDARTRGESARAEQWAPGSPAAAAAGHMPYAMCRVCGTYVCVCLRVCVCIKNNYNCSHDFVFQECSQALLLLWSAIAAVAVAVAGHAAVGHVVVDVLVEAISF